MRSSFILQKPFPGLIHSTGSWIEKDFLGYCLKSATFNYFYIPRYNLVLNILSYIIYFIKNLFFIKRRNWNQGENQSMKSSLKKRRKLQLLRTPIFLMWIENKIKGRSPIRSPREMCEKGKNRASKNLKTENNVKESDSWVEGPLLLPERGYCCTCQF